MLRIKDRQARDQPVERPKLMVGNKLNVHIYKIARVHFLDMKMEEERLLKAHRMIRVVAGTRLFKLNNSACYNRLQVLKKGQRKSTVAKTMSSSELRVSVMVWHSALNVDSNAQRTMAIKAAEYELEFPRMD
ncbi:hypothetical protein KIN20_013429 [Parelaphostrongylus tenuis]|uniref:Uncharacterized protein n=1 Tax=Parelaphostrongylus tenuis TaxID=148309 RepID=A0AAD5MUL1_PARTN|nr:hypothetical protein KIN20_013429 [Parelaphostrongylus tenuis]